MRRYLIIAAVVLVTAVLTCWAMFHIRFVADFPPFDDSDLLPARVEVPDAENGAAFFLKACEKLSLPDSPWEWWDDNRDGVETDPFAMEWSDWVEYHDYDTEMARELIKANEEALRLAETGVECQIVQFPTPSYQPANARRPLFEIGQIMLLRARHLLKQGEPEAAFRELLRTLDFAHRIGGSGNGVKEYRDRIVLKQDALAQLRRSAAGFDLTKDQLLELTARLEEYAADEEAAVEALKSEYQMWKGIVGEIENGRCVLSAFPIEDPPCGGFMPGKTRRLFADYVRALIVGVRCNPRGEREAVSSRFPCGGLLVMLADGTVSQELSYYRHHPDTMRYAHNNKAGLKLFALYFLDAIWLHRTDRSDGGSRSIGRGMLMREALAEENVAVAATRLFFALKAWKLDQSELPETLDSLVPEYLEAVPIDDFDGRPMRYLRGQKVIYSIDSDLVDGTAADWATDIIYKIDFQSGPNRAAGGRPHEMNQ